MKGDDVFDLLAKGIVEKIADHGDLFINILAGTDQCDRRETEYFSQILRAIITQTEESGDHQKYSWSTGRIYVR